MISILICVLSVWLLWLAVGNFLSGNTMWAIIEGAISYYLMRLGCNIAGEVLRDVEKDNR